MEAKESVEFKNKERFSLSLGKSFSKTIYYHLGRTKIKAADDYQLLGF